ncbi:MAG: hypothetical protein KAT69_03570 [Candidatus Aminicenantes bacterium]|nr:hypothetical protein [Candidatus Aminicenantes bacterium]
MKLRIWLSWLNNKPEGDIIGVGESTKFEVKMRKIVFASILSIIFLSFLSLNAQWVKIYGESYDDFVYFLQETGDGGCVVVGSNFNYFDFIYTEHVLMLKLDINGTIEWQKWAAFPSRHYKNIFHFQRVSDGGFILAANSGFSDPYDNYEDKDSVCIIKLLQSGDYQGDVLCEREISDDVQYMQQTSDDGFILTGDTYSPGTGDNDIWVSKLDSLADIEWQRTYGGIGNDSVSSIQETGDGGFILSGNTFSFGAGGQDIWALKLSSTGNIEWQRAYGGANSDNACTIQQTSDGGFILAGDTLSFGTGAKDIWIIKLSLSGDIEWQRTYGGVDNESVCSIQQTIDGGFIVGGNTLSFGSGGNDFLILKISLAGDVEWQRTFGTVYSETACSVRQSSDAAYFITGSIQSFGAGESDFIVLKLLPDGSVSLPCRFLQESYAEISNTNIIPEDTNIGPGGSNIVGQSILEGAFVGVSAIIEYELCSTNPLLTIHTSGQGETVPAEGSYVHNIGTEVSITATPELGHGFTGWSGDASGTSNPLSIILDEDKSITANFVRQYYILTVSSSDGGTTNPNPGRYDQDPGTEVSITAIPETGYKFNEWSGNVSGTDNPVSINMDSDKLIMANFVELGEDGIGDIFRLNCFIATAAYGFPLHPHVEVLRDFRDEYLMDNKIGRELVDLYYKYSPSVARMIEQNGILKVVVRIHLVPFVAFSYSMVKFGPIFTAIIYLSMFLIPLILIIHRKSQGS